MRREREVRALMRVAMASMKVMEDGSRHYLEQGGGIFRFTSDVKQERNDDLIKGRRLMKVLRATTEAVCWMSAGDTSVCRLFHIPQGIAKQQLEVALQATYSSHVDDLSDGGPCGDLFYKDWERDLVLLRSARGSTLTNMPLLNSACAMCPELHEHVADHATSHDLQPTSATPARHPPSSMAAGISPLRTRMWWVRDIPACT